MSTNQSCPGVTHSFSPLSSNKRQLNLHKYGKQRKAGDRFPYDSKARQDFYLPVLEASHIACFGFVQQEISRKSSTQVALFKQKGVNMCIGNYFNGNYHSHWSEHGVLPGNTQGFGVHYGTSGEMIRTQAWKHCDQGM